MGAEGTSPTPSGPPAVRLIGVSKRYGEVQACASVDLDLHRGRVHGILGENGAGKSTLMKILIGLVLPDAGTIEIDGAPVRLASPQDAAGHGIAMVHQHFSLVDQLRVWENVALGEAGALRQGDIRARVGELSERYGLQVDPDATVGSLPVGIQQRVEIIKCLRRDPSILIFDEPTSVLTPAESAQLFDTLRQVVVAEDRAVALVSHRLDEILRVTDEVTVMRRGRVVDHTGTGSTDAASLATAMVGRGVSLRSERVARSAADRGADRGGDRVAGVGPAADDPEPAARAAGPDVLHLDRVTVRDATGLPVLDRIDLRVRPGEIVGVAGVEGNGQRPLADVLSSLLGTDDGEVRVAGVPVTTGSAGAMAAAGVAVVPEDRHDSGIVAELSVAENLWLVDIERVAPAGIVDRRAMRQRAAELVAEFEIDCPDLDVPLFSLSGGNQQRVVLARELSSNPAVLVAAQPTRGLDVGAIEYVTDRIRQAAEAGLGVLLISSEIDEILDLASRIVVISDGRIVGELAGHEADRARIGRLMAGERA
ncbi:MAG: ABC transporter ATP-binding protein [Actinomycetota bacterium]